MNIKELSGNDAKLYITELASLRIEVFREFPYLYQGTLNYESNYLKRYLSAKGSFIFMVFEKYTHRSKHLFAIVRGDDRDYRTIQRKGD